MYKLRIWADRVLWTIESFAQRGDRQTVDLWLLKDDEVRKVEAAAPCGLARVAELRAASCRMCDYEAQHGIGSALDPSHPFNKYVLPELLKSLRGQDSGPLEVDWEAFKRDQDTYVPSQHLQFLHRETGSQIYKAPVPETACHRRSS